MGFFLYLQTGDIFHITVLHRAKTTDLNTDSKVKSQTIREAVKIWWQFMYL